MFLISKTQIYRNEQIIGLLFHCKFTHSLQKDEITFKLRYFEISPFAKKKIRAIQKQISCEMQIKNIFSVFYWEFNCHIEYHFRPLSLSRIDFVSKNMFHKENKSFLNKLSCKDVSLTGLLNFVSVKYDASTTRFYHRFFPNNYLTITVNKLTTDPKLN